MVEVDLSRFIPFKLAHERYGVPTTTLWRWTRRVPNLAVNIRGRVLIDEAMIAELAAPRFIVPNDSAPRPAA